MHDAWKPRGPEWAPLAPGVRWLLRPMTGDLQAYVNARVARTVSNLFQSRADLEDLGFEAEELGTLSDLNVLAGLSVYCSGVYAAEKLLDAWQGIDDPETGQPVEITPQSIRAALRLGTPEGGPALLGPFMAWLDKPRAPLAAELRRLRALSKWEQSGGLTHCEGCEACGADCARGGTDGGDPCPSKVNLPQTEPGIAALAASRHNGVWRRAGMGGQLCGLDYAACLDIAQADGLADPGAFVRCLAAIEAGALEAAAEKAKREA
jgi:hypothetical protein